jgi:hypothetical protein
VFAGIYASGNGKACTSSAQVSWFDYEVLPVKLQKE